MSDTLEKPKQRLDFEQFKSGVCYHLKVLGKPAFIVELLRSDTIRRYYDCKWYPEALYLLAMLDYVSRDVGVPLCTRYDDLRSLRLQEPLYPAGVLILCLVTGDSKVKERARQEAIPEFLRFNIIEGDILGPS